ncbi:unnamed protein product [Arctogadus glacialis]
MKALLTAVPPERGRGQMEVAARGAASSSHMLARVPDPDGCRRKNDNRKMEESCEVQSVRVRGTPTTCVERVFVRTERAHEPGGRTAVFSGGFGYGEIIVFLFLWLRSPRGSVWRRRRRHCILRTADFRELITGEGFGSRRERRRRKGEEAWEPACVRPWLHPSFPFLSSAAQTRAWPPCSDTQGLAPLFRHPGLQAHSALEGNLGAPKRKK